MFENWDDSKLLNEIWRATQCNTVPTGGYPLEWYLEEAIRRGIGSQLYHTEKTAWDYLKK